MKEKRIFGLVCAGGGAHGAYQVGVLKYIHEQFCDGAHSPFRIFTGVSCGSLNTSFFAAHSNDAQASRLWLEELWMSFHIPSYQRSTLKIALSSLYQTWKNKRQPQKPDFWSLLDPKPMMEILHKGFQREHLKRCFDEKTTLGIAVGVTEILSGRACWFQEGPAAKSWNLIHSMGVPSKIEPVHIAASCSVPVFLPPVKIGHHYFLDGSVSVAKPLSAAMIMGANRILCIQTDKPRPMELPAYPQDFKPRLSNVIRMLLNRLAQDGALEEASEIEMFNRFYRALSGHKRRSALNRPHPHFHESAEPSHYESVDVFRFFPSEAITDPSRSGDDRHRSFRKKTSFMFHRAFIRSLIDLGYEDAKKNHEKLEAFFHPDESKRWLFFPKTRSVA